MPATANIIDHFAYTEEDAQESITARVARTEDDTTRSRVFRRPRLTDTMMLAPLLDRIEAETGITIHTGLAVDSNTTASPRYFTAGANIPQGTPQVALVRHASLATPASSCPVGATLDTLPAIVDRIVEPVPPGCQRWSSPTGADLGLIAPHLITYHWWFRNNDSTPEQLEQMYHALTNAVTTAADLENWTEHLAAEREGLAEQASQVISARSSTELNTLRRQVPDLVDEIARHERQANERQARLDEVRLQLRAIEDSQVDPDQIEETAEREIKAILDHPEVADVIATPDDDGHSFIDVLTLPLELVNIDEPEMRCLGGSYRIRMRFGTEPFVEVRNLTRRIGSYDHPHVSGGTFCLGDQRRLADQLLSRSELSASTALIIDLLKQVNPHDVYTSEWEAWFELPESDIA